jgi:hypothetical protein
LDKLTTLAELLELDIQDSYVTLDPGFDSEGVEEEIEMHDLLPIIKPNPRGSKRQEVLHAQFEKFDSIRHIYKERYKVERSFAWEDTYRRLVIRYEKLDVVHEGFKFLAYSMINLRWFIKSK